MASPDESAPSFRQWLARLPPFTADNIYKVYLPIAGAVSYCTFSVTVFIPELLSRLYPDQSVTVANCLLFNSHLGTGLYVYFRPHMARAPPYHRIMYSAYQAVLFNFGSVLLWAVTKSLLPNSNLVRSLFAASTSACFLAIGMEYLEFLDTPGEEDFSASATSPRC
uniref:Putative conserved plasma membrane protein n=1 Tax=Amblyomma triste TaxID=251400 RepID=A0A023G5Z8_AMBTT